MPKHKQHNLKPQRPLRTAASVGVLLAVTALGTAGCASHQTSTEASAPVVHTKIEGKDNADRLAALLLMHEVLDKQRDLNGVMDIPFKDVRPDVEKILEDITAASIRSDDSIVSIIKASGGDPKVTKTVLPKLEIEARVNIEAMTTKEILFGNSKEMEFNVLYNQLQSCRYISQLALGASNISKDQDKAVLRGISDDFTRLYNQTFQVMIKAYKP